MTVGVEGDERPEQSRPGISGAVVHALLSLVREETGEPGVAQALALAAEERSFPVLGDASSWTAVADASALFAAGALVTGDGAIGLHVGEDLLWSGDDPPAGRLRPLGSTEVVVRHVGAFIEQFEGATEAVALEVEPGHALVQVSTLAGVRQAHFCEVSRGLLSQLPVLFDAPAARVTEHECAARGGRACRYVLTWDAPGRSVEGRSDDDADTTTSGPTTPVRTERRDSDGRPITSGASAGGRPPAHLADEDGTAANGRRPRTEQPARTEQPGPTAAAAPPAADELADDAPFGRDPWSTSPEGGPGSTGAVPGTAEPAGTVAEAARSRDRAERLERLIEGAEASFDYLEGDVDDVVVRLAERASRVLGADRYLLMIRAAAGLPLELHHRGITSDEARVLAADLWSGTPDEDGADDTLVVVDIASPLRRYGRVAAFLPPDGAEADGEVEERAMRLFARHAANILDVCTVLSDVRRSDSTARTLLSFSEKLSGLTNLAQALQVLADTVPVVTGSDQSTVYLWDGERSRLVLGAYTAGMHPPDAELGPIVPHWSASATEIQVEATGEGADPDPGALRVPAGSPMVERMMSEHEVLVLDAATIEDLQLRSLMEAADIPASVVAPLFAAGAFLGVIAANFSTDTPTSVIHDPDLHERLRGLADQAATAIQNLELLERVSHMAWHDSLTGLPNRRLFEDRVEQELVRSRRVGEPVCMFFVDLDNFKTVNDTHGHATGDELIQQVGQRLVETVRSQDTVARVGGDEFAILLPGLVDQLAINQLAERTLDAMHTPFDIFGELVTTSASIGIAIAPEHGDSYDDLLNRADEAMYRAKDLGRDAFEMFHQAPDPIHPGRRSVDDRQLYNDLISALDGNEFFLLYQPYIDLRTAQIVGVEALIRWDHPTLGILEPPLFIPMAERSDLIVSLDSWVLWQACRQLRAWQDHGVDTLRLSVNVASRDFANPDFHDSVARTLRDTGIEPSLLELDITDRVVLDRAGPAQDNIEGLRRLGVRFTVDDFGQGNSSLDRIGSFPVSTLKIDQSFVQVLGPSDEESSLVSAIIGMAGRLGLSCVAEGVETLLQSRVLLQRGCTTAQGYYFSPPLPPEGVEEMLANLTPAEVPETFGEPSNGSQPPEAHGA